MALTFVCNHCGVEFLSFEDLQTHKELVPKVAPHVDSWVCPRCDREFSSPGQLKEHEDRDH